MHLMNKFHMLPASSRSVEGLLTERASHHYALEMLSLNVSTGIVFPDGEVVAHLAFEAVVRNSKEEFVGIRR